MEITSAMEAFLEQERRAITENIRRTGVHLTYVAVAAAEGDEPACACCRALGTGPEEAEDAQALAAEGDTDAALAKLQQAVAIDPGNDATRCDYVKLLLELGRSADARRAWEPIAATRDRVVGTVRRLRGEHAGDLVLVGHGTAWTVLTSTLAGAAPDLSAWERLAMPDLLVTRLAR